MMELATNLDKVLGATFEEEFKKYSWFKDIHPYQSGDPEVFIATLKKAGFEAAIAATIKNPAFERMKKRTPYGVRKADPVLLALINANKDEVFKYFFAHGQFVQNGSWGFVRLFFITKKPVYGKPKVPKAAKP